MSTDDIHSLSDESSFYGDDETKSELENQVATYDPRPYWEKIHPHLYNTIRQVERPSEPTADTPTLPQVQPEIQFSPETPSSTTRQNARDANESTQTFLARLPPSTTKVDSAGPWIYVSNPCARRGEQDIATFVAKGTRLLRDYEDERAEIEVVGGRTTLQKARKLVPLRRGLERGIFALARETGVVSGKWMLFLGEEEVDRIWGVVVEETLEGTLGVAAKVATDEGSGMVRLLAIYTRDFEDGEDVRRVLERLVELGLVRKGEKPIYYKSDAYTYLEIMSNNSYGLRASLFSSRDVLEGKV
ncbi:hypothetical protein BDV28DRAFT_150671 [Aspergillus coremiiformis]|uniref:DUF1917-domain-containing protein n=1 Tax=Aspergillus coremiiformis TaxID=138285 RepID=A0A5N6YZ83_9EURO|nr:hypothetical protein BDV28DRAFT_150671 [Aspergillus coremiiformis]